MAPPIWLFLVSLAITHVSGNDVIIGVLGDSASIECSLPATDTLVWDSSDSLVLAVNGSVVDAQSDKYMIVRGNNGLNESLVVNNLTLEDEKVFRCYDLQDTWMKDVIQLQVLVLPPSMSMTVPKETILEGEHVTFVCEADGGKPLPDITWHRIGIDGSATLLQGHVEDIIYRNGTGHRKSSLTIQVTREIYQSTFTCNITGSVFYHQGFELTPDVLLAPTQPSLYGYTGSFDADVPLKLECNCTGSRPAAEIAWYLAGVRVADTEAVVIPEPNGTFSVRSFFSHRLSERENGSILTCAVTNTVLVQQHVQPLTVDLTLTMSHKPVITTVNASVTSREGSEAELWCDVEAVPYPDNMELSWRHEGRLVDRQFYIMPNGTGSFGLLLSNVNRSDSGDYTCQASNRLGSSTSADIALDVQYPPVCSVKEAVTVAVAIGDVAHLRCQFAASPENVTFTWKRQVSRDRLVTSVLRTLVSDDVTSEVAVNIVGSADYGTYLCYGQNSIGMSITPCAFHIVLPGPPVQPSDCQLSQLVSNNRITVSCEPGFDGGSSQSFILQVYERSGFTTKSNDSSPYFTFITSDNATVRVCAVNVLFPSTPVCGESLFARYRAEDTQLSRPGMARATSPAVFIAGGITAFAGIVMILGIVIYLLRRNQKALEGMPGSLKKQEAGATSTRRDSITRMLKSCRRSSAQTDSSSEISSQSPSHTVTMETSNDVTVPYEDIVLLASTPYVAGRTNRQWGLASSLSPVPIPSQSVTSSPLSHLPYDNIRTPELFTGSKAFSLSGIGNLTDDSVTVDILQDHAATVDEVKTVLAKTLQDQHTTAGTVGNAYSAADIADILDFTSMTHGLDNNCIRQTRTEAGTDQTKSVMTLDKDYTAGDIESVLGATANTMARPTCSRLNITSYIIDGTHLSFDADFSQSLAEHQSDIEDATSRRRQDRMKKCLSLPNRLRNSTTENRRKTNSSNILSGSAFLGRITSHSKLHSTTSLEQIKGTHSVHMLKTSSNCTEMASTRTSVNNESNSFMYDIDKFTLTVTDESAADASTLSTLFPDEKTLVNVTLTQLLDTLSQNVGKDVCYVSNQAGDLRSPVRNESFIRAVSCSPKASDESASVSLDDSQSVSLDDSRSVSLDDDSRYVTLDDSLYVTTEELASV